MPSILKQNLKDFVKIDATMQTVHHFEKERNIIKPSNQIAETPQKMLKPSKQFTENQKPTLTPSKGERAAWRTTTTSPRRGGRLLERQAEAGASGVPQDLGKLRGHAHQKAQPVVSLPNGAARPSSRQGEAVQPQKKRLQTTSITPNITRYIGGVGSLNNIKREAPIIPSTMYRRM